MAVEWLWITVTGWCFREYWPSFFFFSNGRHSLKNNFSAFSRGFGFGTVIQQGTIIAVYDHGSEFENNESYGKSDPPVYNLSRIPNELPMFLSYGGQDLLSDVNGV